MYLIMNKNESGCAFLFQRVGMVPHVPGTPLAELPATAHPIQNHSVWFVFNGYIGLFHKKIYLLELGKPAVTAAIEGRGVCGVRAAMGPSRRITRPLFF
jgi:hypothetical protein